MRKGLAIAALVNGVYIKVHANIVAGVCQINTGILFTNRKFPSIHSESVPRSRPKASAYSYAKKHCCKWRTSSFPQMLSADGGKPAFCPSYSPTSKDLGHIVLLLSVCLSICLSQT